jgi:hypothetical protein
VTRSSKSLRIVLGNSSLADYPEGGGHWMYFLQYLLGLVALGHEVLWLEIFQRSGQPARDQRCINGFFRRLEQYGLAGTGVLLCVEPEKELVELPTAEIRGRTRKGLEEFIGSADLLWNFAAAFRPPLLDHFKRRALIDCDPGVLQVSALEFELGQSHHQVFLTVGAKIHDPDCAVPTLGLKWHSFPAFVHLPLWTSAPDPGPAAPFTSVTDWNWGEVALDGRLLSIAKREAYLGYLDLPARSRRPMELAVNLDLNDETGDRNLLLRHGWRLTHPYEVCASPADYQNFIARSRAEICCVKPIYRQLRTGWFSDRSACYLASGRPVLIEDTGFRDHYPVGQGLLVFRDLAEAQAGVAEIDAHYEQHRRAAREFAEAHLDSRRCLEQMLAACN